MSDSEKSSIVEGIASLDVKESEVTEYSTTGETTESVTSSNPGAIESVTDDDAKNKKKSPISIAGAESGDDEEQHFNKNHDRLPLKFRLFYDSRIYLTQEANMEYLARLLKEKENLRSLPNSFKFKHAVRLVNDEIAKIRESIGRTADVNENEADETEPTSPSEAEVHQEVITNDKPSTTTGGKKVFLQEKIFIPVNEYPNYNFVGRILGPRGMTAKQLEEESGCRIMIRGRGSIREGNSHRYTIYNDNLTEELHVLVQCKDFEDVAKEKMKRAVEYIRYMLIPRPDGEDELKRKQLMELSIINGTYRPTIASRLAFRHRSLLPSVNFGQIGVEHRIRGVNNRPIFRNGSSENNRSVTFYDSRTGVNLPHSIAQQYPYNAYTLNTHRVLESLGFDMNAFEVTDCYGKRSSRSGISSSQATATTAAVQYPRSYAFGAPLVDPLTMQYVWNPSIVGVCDNSSGEYYNQVMMTGFTPTVTRASVADGMAQSSDAQPINLEQYLTPEALIYGASNFRTDGSGDGPNSQE